MSTNQPQPGVSGEPSWSQSPVEASQWATMTVPAEAARMGV